MSRGGRSDFYQHIRVVDWSHQSWGPLPAVGEWGRNATRMVRCYHAWLDHLEEIDRKEALGTIGEVP